MKGSLSSFNFFISVIILVPSAILLYQFSGEIGTVCDMSNNVVLYTIITSCMVLLSLMTIIKELLTFE
ncbi:MAG: hypothetical protein ABIG84_07510 [archaeon]